MMTEEYLIRADLSTSGPTSNKLPVCIGPFKLNHSPNAEFYLAEIGIIPSAQSGLEQPDFPKSMLYVERRMRVSEKDNPTACADYALELLECLLRLFQPGEVSVRRHDMWRVHEDGGLTPGWSFSPYDFKPIKPPIEGLHNRPDYPLDDDALDEFIEFFNVHWNGIDKIPRDRRTAMRTAMARFSSSYERRDLADRLIDLVVALEAMFGDGESDGITYDGITYKVATRCACWLYPSGEDRKVAFETVKKLYSARSKAVHGKQPKELCEQQVDDLEEMVRASLLKFLDRHAQSNGLPRGNEIDGLIMTGKI